MAAQEIFKRPINYTEESGLLNLYEYYGFSVPVLLLLVEYCEKIGKARMGYIETIAKSWFERGITEFSAAEKEIIRLMAQHSYEKKLAKALGLETALTKKQRETFARWQDWGFSEEMVLLAYEKCMDNTNKLSLPYMNKILESWHAAGISTPEQAQKEQQPQKKSAGAKQTKPEKQHSYDLNEFEEFARNYTPEVRKKTDG